MLSAAAVSDASTGARVVMPLGASFLAGEGAPAPEQADASETDIQTQTRAVARTQRWYIACRKSAPGRATSRSREAGYTKYPVARRHEFF